MEGAVRSFFSSPRFAVAGASQNPSKFGYKVLAWYHMHGLPVTAINPTTPEIKLPSQGYKTVASPAALEVPLQTALSVITPPPVTRKILEEAKSVGVRAVWLQPGSFDDEILEYAEANFEAAVGGSGGRGGEGWCVLADGDLALEAVNREWNRQKLYSPGPEQSRLPIRLTSADSCQPVFLPTAGSSVNTLLSEPYHSSHHAASNDSHVSRKRLRPNECELVTDLNTQKVTSHTLSKSPSASSSGLCSPVRESPPAFVNTAYRIAGGLDTPSAARLDAEEIYEEQMRELDYRPNRMTLTTRQDSTSYFPRTPVTAARGGYTGRKRARSSDQPGWSRAVVDLVGGVAEKVFNFCWNGAFGGFQAGGGEAYSVKSGNPAVVQPNLRLDVGEKDWAFDKHHEVGKCHDLTPVSRPIPEADFIDDYMSQSKSHRANLLTAPGTPEGERASPLRANWVFVKNTGSIEGQDRSRFLSAYKFPQATSKAQTVTTSKASVVEVRRRPRLTPSRPSLVGSLGASGVRPASYASTRASPGRSNATETNSCGTTSGRHYRSQSSIASPRRARDVGSRQSFSTPSSPDIERFAKQIRRKERREDESIHRLSKQLDDMIKEGKQALGTRIEVEDDLDDDGVYNEGATEIIATAKW